MFSFRNYSSSIDLYCIQSLVIQHFERSCRWTLDREQTSFLNKAHCRLSCRVEGCSNMYYSSLFEKKNGFLELFRLLQFLSRLVIDETISLGLSENTSIILFLPRLQQLQERLDEQYRVNSFNVKTEVVTKRVLEHMVKQIIKETTITTTRTATIQ